MNSEANRLKAYWESFRHGQALQKFASVFASAYGVAVGAAAIIAIMFFVPNPFSGQGDGLILLETPQVFTRGRLVNDRATEQAWLEDQLKRTGELLEKGRFANPEAFRYLQRMLSFGVNSGGATTSSPPAVDEELRKRLASLDVKPTPLEQFEDASRYRTAIRNALMSTVLDDRHDIEGNTIYRLNFNVSVLPPRGSERVAMVVVELYEVNPLDTKGTRLHDAYVDLLYDWRARIQETLGAIINDRTTAIEQFGVQLEPVENSAFHEWLANRTYGELGLLLGVEATAVPDHLVDDISLKYDDQLNLSYWQHVKGLVDGPLKQYRNPKADQEAFFQQVLQECGRTGQINPNQFLPPDKVESSKTISIACGKRSLSSLVVRLDVLDSIQLLRSIERMDKSCFTSNWLPSIVTAIALESYAETGPCEKAVQYARKRRHVAGAEKRRRDIVGLFEAEYIMAKRAKSNLRPPPQSGNGGPSGLALSAFFKPTWPKRCSPGSCEPIIEFAGADLGKVADELIDMVRPSARAFTYAVAPNKIVLRSDVAQRSGSALSAGAASPSSATVSAASSQEAGGVGLESNPTLIGFGDWDSAGSGRQSGEKGEIVAAQTRFGWAMLPRSSMDGGLSRQQSPESYSVSAVVSLPGWWKTAHLRVRSCWVSESHLESGVDFKSICPARKARQPYMFDLRLPGDAQELMQHLRFEVIRTPFLERPLEDPDIEFGREAHVMIRGGRLWRSPVVKLGNQQADRIEVLPDMMGIVATFYCVEPLPKSPGQSLPTESQAANLYVITSEGKTPFPSRVMVRDFKVRKGETTADACYLKKRASG